MGFAAGENGDEGGIARRLWKKFKDHDSVFVLYSPFVVGLASGTLDPKSFIHCISQDVYFLKAFAQAYELAEGYADDEEDQAAIRKLRKRVVKRLNNHHSIVQDWGFEPLEEITSDDATTKYTDFLLATASGKVEGEKFPGKLATPFEKTKLAAYALSAIAPCMRLYSFVSKEIQALQRPDDNKNIYKKWIESLSSEKFETSASRIEDLLDKLSISLTGEELEVVEKLYYQALKLESEFLSAQPITQQMTVPIFQVHNPSQSPVTLFCDFDMTCTAIDSSALIAELAIIAASKVTPDDDESQPSSLSLASLRTTWGDLSSQYIIEYEQSIDSIMTAEPCSKMEGFDYEGIHKALEQLTDFEKKANSRVIHSGVLKGLNLEDIKRAGEHLIFQDGCKKFFKEVEKCQLQTDFHVLSYCWSGDLIRSSFSSGDLQMMNVHSNELVYDGSITTGEILRSIESPTDKLETFNEILKCRDNDGKHMTVYIGGSVGDLLCLLRADIGIVIGLSASLKKLGDQFGISFVPLLSGLVNKQRELGEGCSSSWSGLSGILYTASSWAEIHAFVLGF